MNSLTEETIIKIVGLLLALLFIRKASKIIGGNDGINNTNELYQLVGLCFFMFFGAYMIFKEGNRTDCNSHVYNEWYLGIVFGSLLTVLHLDTAFGNIVKVIDALTRMRSNKPADTPPAN